MAWHSDLHKRKPTGGKKRAARGKRKFERGGAFIGTVIKERLYVTRRVKGGGEKARLHSTDKANVSIPKTGKTQKVKILRVIKNPANVDYNRRGIITKGTIIETEIGTAKVTSRPGQDGIVNAILMEHKAKT
jgi:small subunit ribosomal protein S8e